MEVCLGVASSLIAEGTQRGEVKFFRPLTEVAKERSDGQYEKRD